MKKILFISHDASRTGAVIFLRNLLRWFKKNTRMSFLILLRNGGALESEFAAIAPTSLWDGKSGRGRFQKFLSRLGLNRGGLPGPPLRNGFPKEEVGLVYSNTLTNGRILDAFSGNKWPVLTHVHELESMIRKFGSDNIRLVKKHTRHYLAASEAVKRNLVLNHFISEGKIDVIHGGVELAGFSLDAKEAKGSLARELRAEKNAFFVGGAGTLDWRKAPEIFILLAHTVHRRKPSLPIHFVWIGGDQKETRFFELRYDIERLGLTDRVHFLGAKTNPENYLAAFDVLALTSREDPFPLVCLEAAASGKPILCFDEAGGAKELVETDAGFVLPWLDIQGMADKIFLLFDSPSRLNELGRRAFQKVKERYEISVIAPKIFDRIQGFL